MKFKSKEEPKLLKRTFTCAKCGNKWDQTLSTSFVISTVPDCPNCTAKSKYISVQETRINQFKVDGPTGQEAGKADNEEIIKESHEMFKKGVVKPTGVEIKGIK